MAEGISMKEDVKLANLDKSIREVHAIAREWYKQGGHNLEFFLQRVITDSDRKL
jgi:hypothetical protein